jgi:DNA-binding transcriptional LysR family regulator
MKDRKRTKTESIVLLKRTTSWNDVSYSAYAPSLSVELLPQALQLFEKQCPHVRVILHDLSVSEMIQGLAEERLDAALTAKPLTKQLRGLVFTRLRNYSVCIAFNNHHPLARNKRVSLKQLKNERFITYTRTEYPEYYEWVNTLFRQSQNASPELFEEHDSGTSLITAVEAGRGVAIVPSVFSCVVGQRLTLRELQPGPEPLIMGLAYRSRQLSPAARRFVKLTSALAA